MTDPRRRIPSVERLLASEAVSELAGRFGDVRVRDAVRRAVEGVRREVAGWGEGEEPHPVEAAGLYAKRALELLEADEVPSLRAVVNATGVILHTNLGRAPLAKTARDAMVAAATGYANLEYDLAEGRRGSRYVHCVDLLRELTGAEDALVVNNGAAALILALNTLSRYRPVLVSRGELVEIGGGFRIPEIMERAGAVLCEVGSTNRTRLADYEAEVGGEDEPALVLKVHRSNFRIAGFTEEASLSELSRLASEAGIPLVHDLGSGLLLPPEQLGLPDEPTPRRSLEEGSDVVVFSGDKLLGGPQGGLIVGRGELVAAMRKNPLCRALRVDKVTLAGLEATLRLYREPELAVREIPALQAFRVDSDELRTRVEGWLDALGPDVPEGVSIAESSAVPGGGTYPGVELPSWALALSSPLDPTELEARLRTGSPAVVGRIGDERLLLDARTVLPEDEAALLSRLRDVLAD